MVGAFLVCARVGAWGARAFFHAQEEWNTKDTKAGQGHQGGIKG